MTPLWDGFPSAYMTQPHRFWSTTNKGRHIHCRWGLRQGDPLSPFLFINVDVLTKILNRSTIAGYIGQVGNLPSGCRPTSLQFADDTIILPPMDERSMICLKAILHCFEMFSGLQINLNKTSVYRLGTATDEQMALATSIFRRPEGVYPMKYLGMPLRYNDLKRVHWMPLLTRLNEDWRPGKVIVYPAVED